MSKTFREVIRDIKPNEEYSWHTNIIDYITINCDKNGIVTISTFGEEIKINLSDKFQKTRDKVSFDVAFKEYLNGEEIESCYDNVKYKYINGVCIMKTPLSQQWESKDSIPVYEIANDWYVND